MICPCGKNQELAKWNFHAFFFMPRNHTSYICKWLGTNQNRILFHDAWKLYTIQIIVAVELSWSTAMPIYLHTATARFCASIQVALALIIKIHLYMTTTWKWKQNYNQEAIFVCHNSFKARSLFLWHVVFGAGLWDAWRDHKDTLRVIIKLLSSCHVPLAGL